MHYCGPHTDLTNTMATKVVQPVTRALVQAFEALLLRVRKGDESMLSLDTERDHGSND